MNFFRRSLRPITYQIRRSLFGFLLVCSYVNQIQAAVEPIRLDLSTSRNPCQALSAAFNTYIGQAVRNEPVQRKLVIVGDAVIEQRHLFDMGEYLLCAGFGYGLEPDDEKRRNLAIPKDDEGRKKVSVLSQIFFDNVSIRYRSDEQKKPVVLFQLGSFYNYGWRSDHKQPAMGVVNVGGKIHGDLFLLLEPDSEDDWPQGKLPSLPFSENTLSRTTTVAWFHTGFHRLDQTQLNLTIKGWGGKDLDDIGILHQHSWGVRRSNIRVENLGVGALFYGNSVGAISESYLHRNGYGLVLGDFKIGGGVQPGKSCFYQLDSTVLKGAQCKLKKRSVSGLSIRDSVVEGNTFGNLIINDGKRIDINSVHFEMPMIEHQQGHGVLIGGGQCLRSEVITTCADDSDCNKGACVYPRNSLIRAIRFSGGLLGGNRSSKIWSGVAIGANARASSSGLPQIFIDSNFQLGNARVSRNSNKNCATENKLCRLVDDRSAALLLHIPSSASY